MAVVLKLRNLTNGMPHLILPGVHSAGRSEKADIQLSDDSISRNHVRLHNLDEGLFIEDVGSSNGTYIRGIRIFAREPLYVGDEVRLGAVPFRVDPEVGDAGGTGEKLANEIPIAQESFHHSTNKIPSGSMDAAQAQKMIARQQVLPEMPQQSTAPAGKYPGSSLFQQTTPPAPLPPAPVVLPPEPRWPVFVLGLVVGGVPGLALGWWLARSGLLS
jgi:hypothetical protein